MFKTVTIAIAIGTFGVLVGAFFPGVVAYSFSFLRSRASRLKTFLRLAGRLVAGAMILAVIGILMLEGTKLIGATGRLSSTFEMGAYLIGAQYGFWGSTGVLILRSRRARHD